MNKLQRLHAVRWIGVAIIIAFIAIDYRVLARPHIAITVAIVTAIWMIITDLWIRHEKRWSNPSGLRS